MSIRRKLKWCENHKEPVWWYPDDSQTCKKCVRQLIEETGDESQCIIVDEIPAEYLMQNETKRSGGLR
jgi:hypothetical protein